MDKNFGFKGLEIKGEESNLINIDSETVFKGSRIHIEGCNNIVILDKAFLYQQLFINIKGDMKYVYIKSSKKIINNLKIVSIRGNNQRVVIGEEFSCGGLEIQMNDGNENLSIGDNCLFSWGIKMRTSDGHSVIDLDTNHAINLPKDIIVCDRVWVGEDVRFLKGVSIPPDTIVASAAVVTKTFTDKDSFSVIGGFPAKVIKRNVKWDRLMPNEYNSIEEIDKQKLS
jgi:acetyltransferase-like isoleucine patch superfamily enzyme